MTDVAGSTRLWEARADAMRLAIHRHDQIIQKAIDSNGGQLIKERGEGDSHFCIFTSPDDAVRAAIQIQKHLPQEQWETGAPLVVRMSIHSAHVEPHGGDYYGRDVNRCARIRAAAHGGQILVSDSARDAVQSFDFLDLGLHRLNDLSEQQRIYQVIAPDLQREFPPIKSLNAVKHNLPVQLTSFIGREKELEELRKLRMGPRLISILGPGGAGKTRTALQLAAESVEDVPGGVWFVDLSPVTDGSTIPQKVVEDLYVRVGADDVDEAIAAHFRSEKSLLVLDNCEHVARDAAVFVEKLLRNAPNVYVIATSREPLGVAGERSYRLPPMSVTTDSVESLDDISHLDSVRLLLDRATSKGSDEVLNQSSPSTILELCRKLDGIPLALEQAAANLGVLSPETMLQRLDERLSILSIEDEGVQARHRTLSAAIDWSYDALSEEERNMFLDLAVFSGGWTLQAAEAICEQPKVLDLLQRLVAKSLVWPEATARGDRRFRLLETMREYALEKRSILPPSLQRRHVAYYSHLAKVAEAAGLDDENQKWLHALDADYSNITVALNRACDDEANGVDGLELAVALYRYWFRKGYQRQAANWYQRTMDAAPTTSPELRAEALNCLGIFSWYENKLESARNAYEASLTIFTELSNYTKVGSVLNNLAILAIQKDDRAEAKRLMHLATNAFETSGDDPRLTDALGNLGMLESAEGNLLAATELVERAVKIARRLRDKLVLGHQLTNLLGLYADGGLLAQHLNLLEECIELAKDAESPHLCAMTCDVVASLANSCGNNEFSARMIGAAIGAESRLEGQGSALENEFREKLVRKLQSDLGRQAYRKEIRVGSAMAMEQSLLAAKTYVESI